MIQAKVIADSKNVIGDRITTMIVTFPRLILAELNTHRMFSRNSASSRAIPFKKMLASVWNNPFIPIAWQKDHSGMQGNEYFTNKRQIFLLRNLWLLARTLAVALAWILSKVGLTKQLCNRLLEPFMWHTVIITATEWENFFALRCPQYEIEGYRSGTFRSKRSALKAWGGKGDCPRESDQQSWLDINAGQAEIHMMALAEAMWDAYKESTPKNLKQGEWHIPFEDQIQEPRIWSLMSEKFGSGMPQPQWAKLFWEMKVKIATAMCARVSYTVVGEEGKKPNYENDIKLHNRLAASGHWSPFEHCAQAMGVDDYENFIIQHNNVVPTSGVINRTETGWYGNFRGFIQYRKMFSGENKTAN